VRIWRPLLSAQGNALILALGLSAFAGVISLEIYRRSEVTAKRSEQAQFKDQTRVFMEAVASNLQNPEACTQALYNRVITPGAAVPVSLNYKYDRQYLPAELTTENGREVIQGMVADIIEIYTPGTHDMQTRIHELPGELRRFRASLRAVFRSTEDPKLTYVNWRKEPLTDLDLGLPFYVWVNDANQIQSCFGINSAGSFCNWYRGYYHVIPPPGAPLAHSLSCRQTVHMEIAAYPIPAPNQKIGTCRYAGIRPPGQCPPSSFVPGAGVNSNPWQPDYSLSISDGSLGFTPWDLCLQCE